MLSKLSVKKPYTVIVGIILVIVLGYISFQHMSTDLLPSMNLPYVVVYTPYTGATPEQVESEVTRPMEAAFATLTAIKKLTSQSRDNVSVVIMQFNDGANMDTAMIEISAQLDQLKGTWDDDVGAPVSMKINPDMLPVAILSVTRDDMDIQALSDYVEDELVPAFEGLNGVAAANASGVIEREIDITIEQSRIDVVNSAILKEIDKELAKVERKLNDAQAQIADGWRQLADGKAMAEKKLKQMEDALNGGAEKIAPAIEQMTVQRDALTEQRTQLVDAMAALDEAENMTDEQKAAVVQAAEQLTLLRQQKAALEEQLAAVQSGEGSGTTSALYQQRQAAQDQRQSLINERDGQRAYIDDLKLLDAQALSAEITRLNTEIADAESDLDVIRAELSALNARRSELRWEADALSARIAAAEAAEAEARKSREEPRSDATDEPEAPAAQAQPDAPANAVNRDSAKDKGDAAGAPVAVDAAPETVAADAPAMSDAATGDASADNVPADNTPADNAPVDNTPADSVPANDAPAADAPKSDAPGSDAPKGDAPATDDAPVGNDPVGNDAPVANDVRSNDTPSNDAPAGNAPGNAPNDLPAVNAETVDSTETADAPAAQADAQEPAPETRTEQAPEPQPEPEAEGAAQPEPEPENRPEAEPEQASEPAPEQASQPEQAAQPAPESEPVPRQEEEPREAAIPAQEVAPAPEPIARQEEERREEAIPVQEVAPAPEPIARQEEEHREEAIPAQEVAPAPEPVAQKEEERPAEAAPAPQSEPEPQPAPEPENRSVPEQESRPAPEPQPEPEPAPEAPSEPEAQAARIPFGVAMAEGESASALRSQLSEVKSQLSDTERRIAEKSADADARESAIEAKRREMAARQQALDSLMDANEDIQARIDEAEARVASLNERIAALDNQIAEMDGAIAADRDAVGEIAGQLAAVEAQIQALESAGVEQAAALVNDPKQIKAQRAEMNAGLKELDKGLETLNTNIEKLEQGIIPGGYIDGIDKDTKLSDSREKLKKAREKMDSAFSKAETALSKAGKELAKARKEFNDKREDAFEDAGLDGVITVQMVAQIIGAQNFSMPAGYVDDIDGDQVLVRVGDKYGSVDEIKRMKLFNLDMDSITEVRMLDVASVRMADNRDDVFTKLDGQDGILLSLEKQSTYSTADVADTIMKKAKALQEADPELHIVDLMNQGEYIDLVVDSVLSNLLAGGGLAILVLLLFLLDWRPTLTVAFSIPISVVVAFVCMYFSGITLNVLSLSGLSLGIGMLVDNSIVSIENIYRLHEEERLPLLKACVEGVRTVSGALFSSTLTTICVFLPIVFVQGMARDLFEDMGLTIAYSLLASLLVAMTVVPMMSSYLMRRSKPKKRRIFTAIQRAYAAILGGALHVKPLVLLAALALLVVSGMQVTRMGISFMPEVNSRQMSANLEPDSDMSEADQKAQASQVMTDMLAIPGIQSIGLMNGSGTLLSMGRSGYSYYIIVDETAGVKNVDIARQIEALGDKYHADITAQSTTMDISMMTGSGISVEITGDEIEVLQKIARDIAQIAESTEGVTEVSDGLEDAVPEMRIVVDKEKAIDNSLTTAQVYQFIAQKLLDKTEVGKVTLDGKEMKIQLIEGRNQGLKPEDIRDLEIEVEKEEEDLLVRIGDISEIRDAESLATIQRASQRRMVSVSFDIADGYSANLVSDAFAEKLDAYKLPDGYKAELSGENETVMAIMEDLVWMILVAVLLIFLIMVAQFQSFKSPIIVMFTIPLAFTGGLLALILTGMDLSIVSMLGFLVLSGVVVNNGIVFIDCVNQLRIAGWEKREALVEAGRQRLRPILMTAMTTVLGMSTMAMGRGTGAEMMQPMAVVSIGGLTYATLMTLFVVPVLYDLLNGRKMKAREIQMIREAAGMNGDEVLAGGPAMPEPPVAPVTPVEPAAPVAPAEPVASVEAAPSKPITVKLKKR